MNRRERDFIALFNASWYRNFPIMPGHEDLGRGRALWTIHIGSVVKQCADFMGFFTAFESGGRTDAVIQTASRKIWARIEWEWTQPYSPHVNELKKLASAATGNDLSVFIGYSRQDKHEANLDSVRKQWQKVATPLITFLVTYRWYNRQRHFNSLQTHFFKGGHYRRMREQPALPWQVDDTTWQVIATHATEQAERKRKQ